MKKRLLLPLFSLTTFTGLAQKPVEVYYASAETKLSIGDTLAAIANCEKAVALNTDAFERYNDKGYFKYLRDDEGAVEQYNKALEFQPDYATVYYNRGLAKEKMNRKRDAFDDYCIAIEVAPDYATVFLNRGLLYIVMGKLQEATRDYSTAIMLDPKNINCT